MNKKASDGATADEVLSHLLLEGKINRVESAINQALDKRDDTQFNYLVNKLKKLKKLQMKKRL